MAVSIWKEACPDCVLDHCMDARLGCNESSEVSRSGDVSRAECRIPLPNLVVDFCSPLFLKGCVAVNSQDVADAADSQTLSEEGKFRLQVLAELDAFMHRSNDVCFAQEVVREKLSESDSDSECDASGSSCGNHALHVVGPPLSRRCIQVVHEADDACLLGGPLRSDFGVGDITFLQEGRHQDRVSSKHHRSAKPPFFCNA